MDMELLNPISEMIDKKLDERFEKTTRFCVRKCNRTTIVYIRK